MNIRLLFPQRSVSSRSDFLGADGSRYTSRVGDEAVKNHLILEKSPLHPWTLRNFENPDDEVSTFLERRRFPNIVLRTTSA